MKSNILSKETGEHGPWPVVADGTFWMTEDYTIILKNKDVKKGNLAWVTKASNPGAWRFLSFHKLTSTHVYTVSGCELLEAGSL